MKILSPDTILSDFVKEHPLILPLLFRFGIRLGLGDKTVTEVCDHLKIDPDFFLFVVNSYLEPLFVGKASISPDLALLMADYLEQTNRSLHEEQLPIVEIHLHSFLRHSNPQNHSLQIVQHFLGELRRTLAERIRLEQEMLLPRFRKLAMQMKQTGTPITVEQPREWIVGECSTQALVDDLMQVMIRHLKGEFDHNLCYAVLFNLSTLRETLACNSRLRTRVFLPMLRVMSHTVPSSCTKND